MDGTLVGALCGSLVGALDGSVGALDGASVGDEVQSASTSIVVLDSSNVVIGCSTDGTQTPQPIMTLDESSTTMA